ncbi:MerR family transcriptional regulator [Siphonobacter sp. SORGH_AS_1065]|uniref:MerR family transcriptional regulator n=1 Tax=Siphonobacter sp. SORGH_AS_1065 TaxID=3041795 RepID=UPI00277EEEA2|nr:MerR family transcriptional regulator [Siphonobacter sp. SORGH_AS_1065]MDQ1087499.1 DNA-binding transcriptional MerR regulator [Siphonobacter sp. SORGH_AS_1065]
MTDEKRYYTIREVADMFSFDISKVRYWTDNFPTLKNKVKRNRGGDRMYTKEDIRQLEIIYQLVEERGYTLKGARKYLENKEFKQENNTELVDSLLELRKFLLDLKATLDEKTGRSRKFEVADKGEKDEEQTLKLARQVK